MVATKFVEDPIEANFLKDVIPLVLSQIHEKIVNWRFLEKMMHVVDDGSIVGRRLLRFDDVVSEEGYH